MESESEIQSGLKNIKYHCQKIETSARRQFEIDVTKGNTVGINIDPGSIRFECLAAIISATRLIDLYCANIEANMASASSQDKILWGDNLPEEE